MIQCAHCKTRKRQKDRQKREDCKINAELLNQIYDEKSINFQE